MLSLKTNSFRAILISCLFLVLSASGYAQTSSVRVVVTENLSGQLLPYAMVTIKDSTGTRTLAFQQADDAGEAVFELAAGRYYRIGGSALGYEADEETIGPVEQEAAIEISLGKKENRLEEVVVRDTLPPITYRPDTVIYNARAFYTGRERKLKDLVDKLPGLDVDKDLNVTYKGESVGTLLVEDRPFFGGDTELALRGLPADAISRIEVLEDYKPLGFSVDPFGRKQIALNVLIREEKRNVYFGELAGAAEPFSSYKTKADVFRFNRKANNYLLGGANNINQELLSFKSIMRLLGGGPRMLSDDFGAVSNLMAQISPPVNPSRANSSLVALGGNYAISPSTQLNVFGLAPTGGFSTKRQHMSITTLPNAMDLRELTDTESRQQQNGQTLHIDWLTKLSGNQTLKGFAGYTNFASRYQRAQKYESPVLTRESSINNNGSNKEVSGYLEYAHRAKEGHTLGVTFEAKQAVADDDLVIVSDGPDSREDTLLSLTLIGPEFSQSDGVRHNTVSGKTEYTRVLLPDFSFVTGLGAQHRTYKRKLFSDVFNTTAAPVFQQMHGYVGGAANIGESVARASIAYRSTGIKNEGSTQVDGAILPNLRFTTRLSPASTLEMSWRKQLEFVDAAYFFQGYSVEDLFTYQVGNNNLPSQKTQSADLDYRYSNPIRYVDAGVRFGLTRNEGPQVISAFALSGVNRSIQPVAVDVTTNSWRAYLYAAYSRKGKKIKGELYANVANIPVRTVSGFVTTSVARQWATMKFQTPVGKHTDLNLVLDASRSSFTTARKNVVYGAGLSINVDYQYKRILAEVSGRMDAYDISRNPFLAGNAGLDLMYVFPDSPWALTLTGNTPLGSRRVRTFRQTELSFETNTVLIMRPYLLLGGALQF